MGFIPGSTGWRIIRLINRHWVDRNANESHENFHLLARLLHRRFHERLIKVVFPADDVECRRKLQNTLLWYRQWVNKHVPSNRFPMFWFLLSVPEKELAAVIPEEQIIAWKWAIVFAFAVPECGAMLRSWRLCFFKTFRNFEPKELGVVFLFESLHVIGVCLFAFKVLPELDVIQGAMLTNCLCFVPSIFCKMPFSHWFMCLQHVMSRHAVSLVRWTQAHGQVCSGRRIYRGAIDWLLHLAVDGHVHAQHLVCSARATARVVSLVGKLRNEVQSVRWRIGFDNWFIDSLFRPSSADPISRPHQGQPSRVALQDLFAHRTVQSSAIFHRLRNALEPLIQRLLRQLLQRLRQSHDKDRRSETDSEW